MFDSVRSRRRPTEGRLRGRSDADEGVKKRQGSPTPPFSRWILASVAIFIAVVHLLCARLDSALPPPRLASSPPSLFSETRSREWLEGLVSFGPRPSGSRAAEVLSVDFLLARLQSVATGYEALVDVDVQRPTGCFSLDFLSFFSLCYRNITNVAVRLKGAAQPSPHAVLLNCHFDSVPDSPGASDDGVSCAIAFEILRNLLHSNLTRSNDLIFLFNGGEENILQAAHGFISQHPWSHSIKTFVNLEAAGSGGREMLFQSGPGNSWLVRHYLLAAPYPHVTVMAQEIFQSGVIPSDTDFRIFRDYGAVPGLDVAFFKNGYVYHTEFDQTRLIRDGSIQRAGENVLATLQSLANSQHVVEGSGAEGDPLVFYDIFGLFVVFYSVSLGVVLNGSLFLTAVAYGLVRRNLVKSVMLATLVHLLAAAAMGLTLFFCAATVGLLGLELCWYSRPYLLIPLYGLPCLAVSVGLHSIVGPRVFRGQNPLVVEESCRYAAILLLLTLCQILTLKGFASAYLLVLYAAPMMLRGFLQKLFSFSGVPSSSVWSLGLSHFASLLLPTMFASYGMIEILHLFVPMMGRTGGSLNPELFIGGLVWLASVTILLFFGSFIHVCRESKLVVKILIFLSLLGYLIIWTTRLRHPYSYSADSPILRRLILQHSNRRIFGVGDELLLSETGMLVAPMDYRGSADLPHYTFLSTSRPAEECCAVPEDSFCGFPFYLPVKQLFFKNSRWMATASPLNFSRPMTVRLISKSPVGRGINLTLSLTGSDHITLFVTPNKQNGWRLAWWSLTGLVFPPQQTYFAFLGDGLAQGPWTISLLLERGIPASPEEKDVGGSHSVTVAAAAHYLHGVDQNSDSLRAIRAIVGERREKVDLSHSWWKWAITIMGWSSDYEARRF